MSYALFGARTSLLTYTTVESAFSAAPVLAEPSKPALHAHVSGVLAAAESLTAVVIAIAADAETRPEPSAPATLQELIGAGRARLRKERARLDRDQARDAVTHLTRLRDLVRP